MPTTLPPATRCRRLLFALVLAAAQSTPALADGLFDRPVDAGRLASVRGGFSTASGGALSVSFGIQRTVLVDGTPLASAGDSSSLLLVQRGGGNTWSVANPGSAAGTVLQNTLDGQKLQTVTTLDVTATSLQAFRSLAWQSALRSSIADSLRH